MTLIGMDIAKSYNPNRHPECVVCLLYWQILMVPRVI